MREKFYKEYWGLVELHGTVSEYDGKTKTAGRNEFRNIIARMSTDCLEYCIADKVHSTWDDYFIEYAQQELVERMILTRET